MSSDRSVGMGLGPIPFSSIDRYARRFGLTLDEYDFFRRAMRAMDEIFLEHQAVKARAAGESAT